MTLEQWIEREFSGYGVAVRTQSEPAIRGEPLMSMEVAKELTRRAVAHFAVPPSSGAPVDDIDMDASGWTGADKYNPYRRNR